MDIRANPAIAEDLELVGMNQRLNLTKGSAADMVEGTVAGVVTEGNTTGTAIVEAGEPTTYILTGYPNGSYSGPKECRGIPMSLYRGERDVEDWKTVELQSSAVLIQRWPGCLCRH